MEINFGPDSPNFGYSHFDSIESRISWVKNQSDYGKLYFELVKYYLSDKQNDNNEELVRELEEAKQKLQDSSNFFRECNEGDDDAQLQTLAEDIILKEKKRKRKRIFLEAIDKTYNTNDSLEKDKMSYEDQMAKLQIVNCMEERIINQRNFITELEIKLQKPNFENLIKQNIWKNNRDYQYSKHPRYQV